MSYQFRIQLANVDHPKVWRQIKVPDKYMFFSFHEAIRAAFGWKQNFHFSFSPDENQSDPVISGYQGFSKPDDWTASETPLFKIFTHQGQTFTYTYNPGIKWVHHIELEKIVDDDSRKSDCLAGEGSCPPEHCTGPDEYENIKKIMADKNHPDYANTKQWAELDDEWNPYLFDLALTKERMNQVTGGPECFREYHIISHNTFNEKYGLSPSLWNLIDQMNMQVQQEKFGAIVRLQALSRKHSDIPHFRNMLAAAFLKKGEKKRFLEMAQQLFQEFPDYVFIRCNLALFYIGEAQLDKALYYIGNELNLASLFPSRNSGFTEVEIFNYHITAFKYLIAKKDLHEAQNHFVFLEHYYPNISERTDLFFNLMSLRMEKNDLGNEGERNVEVIPEYVASTNKAPVFSHPEVEIFYHTSLDIDRKILRDIMAFPRETLIEDMKKMLMDSIARFEYFSSRKWPDTKLAFPVHALYVLSSLRAEEALDTVFTMMRQSEEYYEFWLGDMLTEDFWHFLYLMGQNHLDRFKDFLLEPNRYSFIRTAVSNVPMQVALHQEHRKKEVFEWYGEVLRCMIEKQDDTTIFDTCVFSSLVGDVVETGDKEQFPLIEQCYESGLVSEFYGYTWQEVKIHLVGEKREYQKSEIFSNINQFYDYWEKKWNWSKKDQQQSPDVPAKPSMVKPKTGRNDPCPCGSGKKYKKCCGAK